MGKAAKTEHKEQQSSIFYFCNDRCRMQERSKGLHRTFGMTKLYRPTSPRPLKRWKRQKRTKLLIEYRMLHTNIIIIYHFSFCGCDFRQLGESEVWLLRACHWGRILFKREIEKWQSSRLTIRFDLRTSCLPNEQTTSCETGDCWLNKEMHRRTNR